MLRNCTCIKVKRHLFLLSSDYLFPFLYFFTAFFCLPLSLVSVLSSVVSRSCPFSFCFFVLLISHFSTSTPTSQFLSYRSTTRPAQKAHEGPKASEGSKASERKGIKD